MVDRGFWWNLLNSIDILKITGGKI